MSEMAFIMVTSPVIASVRYFSGMTWTSSVHAGFKEPLRGSLSPTLDVEVNLSP